MFVRATRVGESSVRVFNRYVRPVNLVPARNAISKSVKTDVCAGLSLFMVYFESVQGKRGLHWTARRCCTTSEAASTVSKGPSPRLLRASGWWLMGSAGSVFVMIVLGGTTRLTRSGLSMVEWSPMGRPLPGTDEEWASEFEKYKQYPEYKIVNRRMSLDEFKFIYFMEWFHRMWGRAMGVGFAVPGLVLAGMGGVARPLWGLIGSAFALGGAQGLVGWWMVRSGLEEAKAKGGLVKVPRVSPYRLTAHLATATGIYSILLWASWNAFSMASPVLQTFPAAKLLSGPAHLVMGLAGITIISGGFVAGNDAGRAFNDWPMYAGRAVPEGIWDESLGAKNFTENTATVQFDHRTLAYATLASTIFALARWRKLQHHLPPQVNRSAKLLGAAAIGQVSLGIATLMTYVPVPLGVAHQAGAILLWTAALGFRHSLKTALKPMRL